MIPPVGRLTGTRLCRASGLNSTSEAEQTHKKDAGREMSKGKERGLEKINLAAVWV